MRRTRPGCRGRSGITSASRERPMRSVTAKTASISRIVTSFIDPPPYPSPRRGRGTLLHVRPRAFIDPPPYPSRKAKATDGERSRVAPAVKWPGRRGDCAPGARWLEWPMAEIAAPPQAEPALEDVLERVLEVVRDLARETGGDRARRAAAADASLDREVGLGSLERVELLLRLERAFGRPLDDRYLQIDTAAGLARALLESAGSAEPLRLPERGAALEAAASLEGEAETLAESVFRHAQADS